MGSVLALCANKDKRFSTTNARFMIHQPSISAVIRGHATDLEIHAKEIIKTRKQLVDLYAKETGQKAATIDAAIESAHVEVFHGDGKSAQGLFECVYIFLLFHMCKKNQ